MNRDEFKKITAEVVASTADHMSESVSFDTLLAATITMIMFSHDLADKLFESEESIEMESDKS